LFDCAPDSTGDGVVDQAVDGLGDAELPGAQRSGDLTDCVGRTCGANANACESTGTQSPSA